MFSMSCSETVIQMEKQIKLNLLKAKALQDDE